MISDIAIVIPALIARFAPKDLKAEENLEAEEEVVLMYFSKSSKVLLPFCTSVTSLENDSSTPLNFLIQSVKFVGIELFLIKSCNSPIAFFVPSDIDFVPDNLEIIVLQLFDS